MSESKDQNLDHWKSLADEVGAEVPPESAEDETRPVSPTSSDTPRIPKPALRAARRPGAKPPTSRPTQPNHWGELAGALGLEGPVPAEAPHVAEEDLAVTGPQRDDAQPRELSEPASAVTPRTAHHHEPGPVTRRGRDTEPAESSSVDFVDQREPVAESTEDEDLMAEWESSDSLADELDMADEDVEFSANEAAPASGGEPSATEESDQRRKRRRRRGRRSRRDRDERPAKQDVAASERAEEASSGAEHAGKEGGAVAEALEEVGESDEIESGDERDKAHKFPTWEEAIGVVIAANLESRAKSPSGRRGRERGRGRS